MPNPWPFTPRLWPAIHDDDMADFLVVVGIFAFMAVMLGLIWALDRV
jgi:hypothetical protein